MVLGAAIGTVGSIATTMLNAWLSRDKPDYFDARAMKLLKDVLTESQNPWHDIRDLSHVVGLSPSDTGQLLLMIGARGHESGSGAWALISRVGTRIAQLNE